MTQEPTYEELKKKVKDLEKEAEKNKQLIKAAPYGMFLIDLYGIIIAANETGAMRLGKTSEEIIGTTLREYFSSDVSESRQKKGIEVIKSGKPVSFEDQIEDRYYYNTISPVFNNQGKVEHLAIYGTDITDRKGAEKDFQKLALVVKYSSELVNLATLDGKMIFLNEAGSKMLGISPDEVERFQIMEVIPDHLKELVQNEVVATLTQGNTWEGDLQYRNIKTGELTDVHVMTFTIQEPNTGKPLFLANVSLDITKRKQAEEALRKSEEKYRLLAENVSDNIWLFDLKSLRFS